MRIHRGTGRSKIQQSSEPLSAEETKIIRSLASKKKPATAGQIGGVTDRKLRSALQGLLNRSLVEEIQPSTKRKKPRYTLTQAGMKVAGPLPPAKLTLKWVYEHLREQVASLERRGAELQETVRAAVEALHAENEQFWQALEALQKRLEGSSSQGLQIPLPLSVSYEAFKNLVEQEYRRLDREGSHGGLVPIPALRDALNSEVNPIDFDQYLLQMARERLVDLHPHHDPSTLPEEIRGKCVHHPQSGYFYLISWREGV